MDHRLLEDNLELLCTGVGLDRCSVALNQIEQVHEYSQVIHFGVSGSLHADLLPNQLIRGIRYMAKNKPTLSIPVHGPPALDSITPSVFYSNITAITDEAAREEAISLGSQAVDMESYAVAEFCHKNQLPLMAIRCISDRAGASTLEDFKLHYKQAAEKVQRFLMQNILQEKKVSL